MLVIGVRIVRSAAFNFLSHPLTDLMDGIGENTRPSIVADPADLIMTFQVKLSLVSSALAPCTFIQRGLSHGNGTINFNISPTLSPSSRLMIITGIVTLIMALSFL